MIVNDGEGLLLIVDPGLVNTLTDVLSRSEHLNVIYFGNKVSSPSWILQALAQSSYALIDCAINELHTGLIVDKMKTWYYNNTVNLKDINPNELVDPLDFCLKYIDHEKIEKKK